MSKLSPTQFDLFGGEHPYGGRQTVSSMKPPDVVARLDRSIANQGIPQSYRNRMADEDYEDQSEQHADFPEDVPNFKEAQPHPLTGLPDRGNIDVNEVDLPHADQNLIGIPMALRYHGHDASQRRKVGSLQEVPLDTVRTIQPTVQSSRFHEILSNPSKAGSPRFPGQLQVDVPFMHRDPHTDTHTVLDGNHRTAAAIWRNEMFTPARVVGDQHADDLARFTRLNRQRQTDYGVDPDAKMKRYFSDEDY